MKGVGVLGLLVAVASTALLGAGAAVADDAGHGDLVGVSRDGQHWTQDITTPLFDPAVRWVPGDRRTTTFYVRNQATDGGDLTVAVERTAADGLAGTGWLSISARAGSAPWRSVTDSGRHQIVDLADVAPGDVVPVRLRVTMSRRAPNHTMVLATHLGLHVNLSEDLGSAAGHGGVLPNTGSPVPAWLPFLGAGLVLTGLVLSVRHPSRPSPSISESSS